MITSALAAIAVFLTLIFAALSVVDLGNGRLDARARALLLTRRPANMAKTPFRERVLLPLIDGVTRALMEMLPHAFVARVRKRLTAVGKPMSVEAFFALVILLGSLLPASLFLILWTVTDGAPGATLLFVPLMAAFSVTMPFLWLSRRARARQLAIWKSLPAAIDLITTCVEAGLGLDAAFQRVADKFQGPLTEEVRQMLMEVEMGRPRRAALEDLANRTAVPEISTFVNAVLQAQQLGTNLGRVLRAQAHQLRIKRWQRAEETARRMPAKMVFPLILCMMPALFIVIIGPIAVSVFKVFSE
jgi:tight adherence protein C